MIEESSAGAYLEDTRQASDDEHVRKRQEKINGFIGQDTSIISTKLTEETQIVPAS